MPEYKPVPVDAARRMADDSDKDIVVVIAWNAMDKMGAAKLGDIVAGAAGCDLSQKTHFEDFRTRTQTQWAQKKDQLTRRIRELEMKLDRAAEGA